MNKSKSVTLENIVKIFKDPQSGQDVKAVDNVSFRLEPGELVTLLGPSGCGKTTVLRMLSGFEQPTSGRIMIGDTDVTFTPPNKRDTAMVFQSYGLFPHMNVFDNVAYGLRLRKIPESDISLKVSKFLDMVGLGQMAKRPPSRLSGGQQQRVALARSLIVEPSVLLLDEPLSNLDALLREQMRVEIRRLQKSLGITAVYVTHDRIEAMSLSDKIIVMKGGHIAQIGTPSDIYRDPANTFVAGFVGKVAFFPCAVKNIEQASQGSGCEVEVKGRVFRAPRWANDLKPGDKALVMARPESLSIGEAGTGVEDGIVTTNIYLGNSVESWVHTDLGDVLVQIDNPDEKKIFAEGESVSLSFNPNLTKILVDDRAGE
ncbi:MAG: ABC transporter ATP-binding protein [Synergistaceae bacterium]|nr:ABC transporter ATP-binding protein [Synergistaceae bacterium]MBQ4419900.1 ABC transporter ATP-binding protein [Synergistaceae bacterium]MBQ7569645.1 ABC transporter ATP-binding protein [Synergistaceae bacterium]MBQ9581582.1 ABC transporter ATP-binding protein [Synergistaceae bacterium]MBR0043743.1 ABC transporter ATP-binding protein [Synergistaceae bacterium]